MVADDSLALNLTLQSLSGKKKINGSKMSLNGSKVSLVAGSRENLLQRFGNTGLRAPLNPLAGSADGPIHTSLPPLERSASVDARPRRFTVRPLSTMYIFDNRRDIYPYRIKKTKNIAPQSIPDYCFLPDSELPETRSFYKIFLPNTNAPADIRHMNVFVGQPDDNKQQILSDLEKYAHYLLHKSAPSGSKPRQTLTLPPPITTTNSLYDYA